MWLVVFLAMSGCYTGSQAFTSGTPIDPAALAQIKVGTTTKAEVEGLLGVPPYTAERATGEVWVYYFTSTQVGSGAYVPFVGLWMDRPVTESKSVGIEFDPAGLVTGVSKMQTTPPHPAP